MLRRARRTADVSQREMAAAAGVAKSTLAAAEAGTRDLPVGALVRAAAVAGLRLVLVDAAGAEVLPMADDAVRDMVGRHFPAHLDTRYSEEEWWHGPERYSRRRPWYTFDRDRQRRDAVRRRQGTAADHQLPQPGDSPRDRSAARRRAAVRRAAEERDRRRAEGLDLPLAPWVCDCPAACTALEDWQGRPKHAADCSCSCDPC